LRILRSFERILRTNVGAGAGGNVLDVNVGFCSKRLRILLTSLE